MNRSPTSNKKPIIPEDADGIYQSGVRWLLNHTRPEDNKKFDLLFKENTAYGFRRNALGTKPLGLVFSFGSILWTLTKEKVLVAPLGFLSI